MLYIHRMGHFHPETVIDNPFLVSLGIGTDEGVSIFVELIGSPVFRATLKALARPAVLTTAGWKEGMDLSFLRAIECKKWHVDVHTHFARYDDGLEAVAFAEQTGWMAPHQKEYWAWQEILNWPEISVSAKRRRCFHCMK